MAMSILKPTRRANRVRKAALRAQEAKVSTHEANALDRDDVARPRRHWVHEGDPSVRERVVCEESTDRLREASGHLVPANLHALSPAEEARLLATIVASSHDAIISHTPDGIITSWNKGAERLYGYTAGEIVGSPTSRLVPPDRAGELAAILTRLERGQNIEGLETVRIRKDGAPVAVVLNVSPIKDESGRVTAGCTIASDITRRKRAEEERAQLFDQERQARADAETANRLKDEFLAAVSHELRTPLNAILGWARMLSSKQLTTEGAEHALETIERSGTSLALLIADLLDVSRIATGKLSVASEPVDLLALTLAALDVIRPAAAAKGIDLQVAADAASLVAVQGDADRLQQVIGNLLTNAVKFTPAGGHVDVTVARAGQQMEVKVVDSGRGIAANFLPHVFERFRQGEGIARGQQGGLGLGLSIVRQIVELHGGTVRGESAGEGSGAAFTVALPIPAVKATVERRPLLAERRSSRTRQPLHFQRLDGVRIVVVDGDDDGRALTALWARQSGAKVTDVGSAREALHALAVERPDVLVTDIGLPDEDGYELVRQIRQREAEHGGLLPAIALTGYARAEDRTRALAAGFQSHVIKPVEPAELVATIAALARMSAAHRRVAAHAGS